MSTTTVKWQDRTWPSYLGSCINTDRTGWIRTVSFYQHKGQCYLILALASTPHHPLLSRILFRRVHNPNRIHPILSYLLLPLASSSLRSPLKNQPTITNYYYYYYYQGCRMRSTKTDFVSCPSCGRTLFDLQEVTEQVSKHFQSVEIWLAISLYRSYLNQC